ncbi:MAG TPA: hypothetical protein QF730_00675 [Planctomycetota bacterium]|nr:hypothetical protein [Planctomycetota bacterium]
MRFPLSAPFTLLGALAATILSPGALADTIIKVDGSQELNCTVVSESLTEVVYKQEGRNAKRKLAAGDVLRIEFSRFPDQVDRAEMAVIDDQIPDAVADLEEFVAGVVESGKPHRKHPWSGPYAMARLVELNTTMGRWEEVVQAADTLLSTASDSRYVSAAFLAKAEALGQLDKGKDAAKTLEDFLELIRARGLSDGLRLECQLAQIVLDPELKGRKKRDRLAALSGEAGSSYPVVRNRADVAEAESHLESKAYGDAEELFERVISDPKADARTLAGAYAGLGDCLFQRSGKESAGNKDKIMHRALLAYLRVVVVYRDQTRYVPRAMFFAGRVFDQFEDDASKEHAQKMYRAVRRTYPGSKWAEEARGFKR